MRYKEPEWKKWKELLRTVDSRSEANTKLTDLEVEIRQQGATRLEAGKVTFRQLATYCKEHKYTPATYDADGTKLTGVRSVKGAHIAIDHLVEYFGDRNITKIDFDDMAGYKKHRLSQKKKNGKPIKLATAHRHTPDVKETEYVIQFATNTILQIESLVGDIDKPFEM